ncbi:MAG: biotin synthase BioB [Bacillota bacterium]
MLFEAKTGILTDQGISKEKAYELTYLKGPEILDLLSASGSMARKTRGNRVETCAIVNARSGGCSEDCRFCSQSSRYETKAPVYPFLSPENILRQAIYMEAAGAKRFSLVTSGRGISDRDFDTALATFALLKRETGLKLCSSFGIINEEKAVMLKQAGVEMYHHNLEASSGYFPLTCTTHSHQDRINTIKTARKAGLRICAGGIMGIGETFGQRVDLAFEIRDLGIDSVPVNFLKPIKGTPLENTPPVPPLTLLQILAIFRLIMPGAVIRLCGGRQNLGALQPLAFMAGADGVMIGNYLTTKGEDIKKDMQMLADLGLQISLIDKER